MIYYGNTNYPMLGIISECTTSESERSPRPDLTRDNTLSLTCVDSIELTVPGE